MKPLTIKDLKTAILQELAQAGKALNKFNLLGGRNLSQRGPLEHRLSFTFDTAQRALAARAFDELKQGDLLRPTYTDLADPENWVEITEAGREALRTGEFEVAPAPALTKFGIQDAL
jgi:hypothetical protein